MNQWEYSEVWYTPEGVAVNTFSVRGNSKQQYELHEWASVLSQLGGAGWELVSVLASPSGNQYWYYFKRSVAQ